MNLYPHKKFLFAIERFNLVKENDKILVAVSGGPDSTSCLLNLKAIEKDKNLKLYAIYIDHGLREDVEEDKKFVRDLCEKLNIPLFIEKIEIKRKGSVEEKARKERIKIFEKYLKKYNFDKIATGHNLNDVIETLLFRILRGGFGEKIIGISPLEGNFIRPLILTTKEENISYLKKLGVNYRIDITNFDFKITRNFIRYKIVPLFKEIFPDFEKGFLKTYISFYEQRDFIKKHIENIYKENLYMKGKNFFVLKMPEISDYEVSELSNYIFQKFEKNKSINFYQKEEIKKIYKKGNGRVSLSKDIFLEISMGYFSIFKEIKLKRKEKIKKGILKWEPLGIKIKINENIGGFLRNWEEGDYIIINRKKKKMKKIFNEFKIPRFLRKVIPVIAKNKKILWSYPSIFSDELKKTKNSVKIIEIKNET
ncbi:MAG: tRNA lysidine(34) synthetase TilS [candidate division WOR-3 bacterium]